ncbi:uncharacterized protein LOC116305818 [Actinia tenebrosa]|uniref:phosphatidylinositol-3,5-bisphosphate 3-phosphatase n=1 Tax=Actinia tenebrosa TaxID=6105 RepID=A0A6P8IWY2_ACTTE|nr:uncharacterized protein LOC116305818 [Actinia tenebrosa]
MSHFYVPSAVTADISSAQNLAHLSPISSGLMAFQKRKGVGTILLTITVVEGRQLPVMDPNGKSDPYCIVSVGGQEQTTAVQYATVNPEWRETFQFEVPAIPQSDTDDNYGSCLIHYATIDIWDKDTLNRDDFMGRVMVPISTLNEQPTSGWYPLGRAAPKDNVSGEIFLKIQLVAKQPIPRWNVDTELLSLCKKKAGFELPFVSGDSILDFPGEAEHVEMVLEDVVVEVSKHRGIGRVYLTDFRLVILCNTSSHVGVGHCDMSMWVALNNIQSVDKGEDEKVVRRTAGGNAAFADVKTLTIRCLDFRTIYLTFMNSHQPALGVFFLPPGSHSSQSSPDSIAGSAHQLAVEEGEDASEQRLLDITVPELERLNSGDGGQSQFPNNSSHDDITRSSSHSSFQVLSKSSSSGSVEGLGILAGSGVLGVTCLAGTSTIPEKSIQNDLYSVNFLPYYVNVLYQRIAFHILNAMDSPPSKIFIKYHSTDIQLDYWSVYDYDQEYSRQGISSEWRVSRANLDFAICHSYPKFLVVPAKIEDTTLKGTAHFRCKGRIAALSWFNSKKGNFIMRCAQPKTGAMGKFSTEDEYVIRAARKCNPISDRLVIFDARSLMAASGNMLMGKGTEDTVNRYQGCTLVYLDIPNIHAVRDSIERLQGVCESSSQKKWLSHLESTQWLAYIAAILKGATTIARFIEKGVSALVHCSDGWDRTSQLTSLAQILLDPYYRTFTGFLVLIEKEWISFGHRFRDRLGHPSCPSQRSPIFLQFLDCVWQIYRQFPTAFEFTSDLILQIADHMNSQWFGNFLHNNVRDRHLTFVSRSTVSLWSHLYALQEEMKNTQYSLCSETLLPASSLRRLQLWSDYFLRYDETAWSAVDVIDIDEETSATQVKSQPDTVVWVPDERVKECHDCKQRFTRWKRKHHCRACGQVFCGDCSKQKITLPQFGYTNPERVCESCYQQNKMTSKEEEVGTTGAKLEVRTLLDGKQENKSDGEISDSDSSWEGVHENVYADDDDDDDDGDDNGVNSKNDTHEIKCVDGYF